MVGFREGLFVIRFRRNPTSNEAIVEFTAVKPMDQNKFKNQSTSSIPMQRKNNGPESTSKYIVPFTEFAR